MNIKKIITAISISLTAASCTFFETPVDDIASPTTSPATTAGQSASSPSDSGQSTSGQTAAGQAASAPATQQTISSNNTSYLIVAPIENIPEDAGTIAVVHFTRDNTERALALCKALTQSLQLTEVQDLPVNAGYVALWPVANDNAGGTCLEMLTDYEPIDITVEAAKRVNDTAEGPFLLTQHMESGKRMVYDMSYVTGNALDSAVGGWKSLVAGDSAGWPDYRSAR